MDGPCLHVPTVKRCIKIQSTLNRRGYRSIVRQRLVCAFNRKTTHSTPPGYVPKKESKGVLHQITWPQQSPELSPGEVFRDELDRRVKEEQPMRAQHRCELFKDCGKCIPGDDLMKLVVMPVVYKAVIRAKGPTLFNTSLCTLYYS